MSVDITWRVDATDTELNALHAEAFDTPVYSDQEWSWNALLERHSLGWVVARDETGLVGFVNVVWDGLVHAWLQDTMVAARVARRGIATRLVEVAAEHARNAGCEYLHVDFEEHLRPFYVDACGFEPTSAAIKRL